MGWDACLHHICVGRISPMSIASPLKLIRTLALPVLRHFVCRDWELVRSSILDEHANLLGSANYSPPLVVQKLLISGEDHRHARHLGIDPIAICRAIWRRLTLVSREGASTIEQQLVRTITGNYKRTIRRKFKEIVLALLVDFYFDKSILPPIYLSIAYYGWRMNGYAQACRRLDLNPTSITRDEAASLVSRLKYPEPRIAPPTRLQQIRRRKEHLLELYERHVHTRTYEHIDGTTVHAQLKSIDSIPSVSSA